MRDINPRGWRSILSKIPPFPGDLFLFLAVLATSAAVLMTELLSMRASKVAFGLDFQFFIIPLALLGIGLGGIVVLAAARTASFRTLLYCSTILYPLTIAIPFLLANYHVYTGSGLLVQVLFFGMSLAGYMIAGLIVSFAFALRSRSVSLLYFIDLAGAAAGVGLAVFLLQRFGYEDALFAALMISLLPATFLYAHAYSRQRVTLALTLLLVLGIPILYPLFLPVLKMQCGEKAYYPASNAYSWIEVRPSGPLENMQELGVSANGPHVFFTPYIVADCSGFVAPLVRFERLDDVRFLRDGLRSIPFAFMQSAKGTIDSTLISGSGGGIDVIRALLFDTKAIDAVDINDLLIGAVRMFLDETSYPYAQKGVHLHIDENRRFMATTKSRYDIIVNARGARYGTELVNADLLTYTLTTQAYILSLERLTPGGVLALGQPARFGGKTAEEVRELGMQRVALALHTMGLDPVNRIVSVPGRNGVENLILVRVREFSEEERRLLENLAHERGFPAVLIPDRDTVRAYLARERGEILTDDRPFHNASKIFTFFGRPMASEKILLWLGAFGLAVYLAIMGIPLRERIYRRKAAVINLALVSGFFLAIGLGLVVFEIAIIQKVSLFLANFSYSAGTALAAILIFGSVGSIATKPATARDFMSYLTASVLGLLIFLACFILFADSMISRLFDLSFFWRAAITALALAVPSFLLGMLFPLGLKAAAMISRDLIPWAWALDGIAGVLGGLAARAVSLEFGITATLLVVGIAYVVAWICFRMLAARILLDA